MKEERGKKFKVEIKFKTTFGTIHTEEEVREYFASKFNTNISNIKVKGLEGE